MATLTISFQSLSRTEIPLESDVVTIGRTQENDIVIDHQAVSRQHARISRDQDGQYIIEDCGSRDGLFLKSRQHRIESHALQNRDIILIGKHRLRFNNGLPAKPTPTSGESVSEPAHDEHRTTLASRSDFPVPPADQAWLEPLHPSGSNARIPVTRSTTTIGHGAVADHSIPNPGSDGLSVTIAYMGSGIYQVIPVGGWMDAFLNHKALSSPTVLHNQDLIEIGNGRFRFNMDE
ncbi:MAG: FHA domain-containing protein [Magnetococcales bacterium]|nr:FHA domain-containing protein [Magnetococcales bacterium]